MDVNACRRVAALLVSLFAFAPITVAAEVPRIDATLAAKIDADVGAIMKRTHTPGVALAVVSGGRIVYAKGYGVRNVATGAPVEPDTPFEIGSMTKQFTAAAVLQLRDAGKISLDAPLATYLPNAPHAKEVTIRQLLSHTGGMPEYLEGPDLPAAAAVPLTPDALVARIAAKPLTSTPGTTFAYSNTDYLLLGRVIETVSGESYGAYVRSHLLEPAGMTHTTTIANEASLPDRALGYAVSGSLTPSPALDDSWAWAAGNIVSTVGDVAKWSNALRNGTIVPAADYREMTTPVAAKDAMGYGFGLVADTYGTQARVWHNGGTFGFDTNGSYFPAKDVGIIAFTNLAYGPAAPIVNAVFTDLFPGDAPKVVAATEDPAITARVKAFVVPFLQGNVDRTQMTGAANAALTPEKLAPVIAQLKPLGTPTFTFAGTKPSGSKNPVLLYDLTFAQGTLRLSIHIDPATDKFDIIYFAPE